MGGGLSGGREHAVQTEVYGLSGIVIGPGARKDEHDGGAGEGAIIEKRNGVGEVRVIHFGESGSAEIE
jgi:hypothetical protein